MENTVHSYRLRLWAPAALSIYRRFEPASSGAGGPDWDKQDRRLAHSVGQRRSWGGHHALTMQTGSGRVHSVKKGGAPIRA